MKIIKPDDVKLAEKVIFARPINEIQKPIVSLVGAFGHDLVEINNAYNILVSLGCRVNVYLLGSKSKPEIDMISEGIGFGVNFIDINTRVDAQEQLAEIDANSSLVVVGFGMNLTSSTQILLESWLHSATVPVVLYSKAATILHFAPSLIEKSNLVFYLDSAEFVKFCNHLKIPVSIKKDRGIYNFSDNFERISKNLAGIKIFVYDKQYLYGYDGAKPDEMLLCMINGEVDAKNICLGIIAAFLSFPLRNLDDTTTRARAGLNLVDNDKNSISEKINTISSRYKDIQK